ANWDNSTQQDYLETSRALTQAAHEALGGIPGTKPLVVDPFAGGGSIPLEALRVGADAFASDLNPVAVLLNKVVLEYIPKYGQKLADEVRKWGQWVKEEAEKELAEFYPKDPDGATPIAYLWARTIVCEGPGCGAEVPLMRSLWFANKSNKSVALKLIPNPEAKRVDFEISGNVKAKDIGEGTVKRGSGTCPCCGYTTPVTSVRKQLKARNGGANDALLFCVVTTRESEKGRFYRLPTDEDLEAVKKATEELEKRKWEYRGELSLVPDEPTPDNKGHRAVGSVWLYGMEKWGDVFTHRQALALTTLVRLVKDVGEKLANRKDEGLAIAVQSCLALAVDRCANQFCSLAKWHNGREVIDGVFARQALPMLWDFGEINLVGGFEGYWQGAVNWVLSVVKTSRSLNIGQTQQANAATHPLPDDFAQCFFSDPPYYDAVPYADLSDFFYVWLKRTLPPLAGIYFTDKLTPKKEQAIVWHPNSAEEKLEFEKKMSSAMAEGCRILSADGVGVVVFAHKSTSGWEAMLQAMVDAGWTMTGSWPIDTEMGNRMNAMGTASLASSIHLVCRPRNKEEIGDWRDVLKELPQRIHEWMPRLASEGVVGADAIFACLGPALEIFSRYSHVEKASGEQVTLKDYLEYVWAAVSKEALSMIFTDADATGFEEDARLTAMWLWTLSAGTPDTTTDNSEPEPEADDDEETSSKSTKTSGYVLEFDAARKIAQGLGAHLENLRTLIQVKGDKARLLPVSERAPYLFGKDQGKAPTKRKKKEVQQLTLFTLPGSDEEESTDWGETAVEKLGNTVLDRIHQSMILFAAGRSEALKRFLVEDGVGADQRFWKLAQALSALYPNGTDEKRWVDGVLARKKGLGF
ncbi:MAG TPA: adenine-specific DNA methylase, partial [Cyanobacteria bacterium UBA9273]|nr:adenine-specific DNA methylase [Cyanobacteria bacterium UBA9273]